MPDWCSNHFTVSGDEDEVARFMHDVCGGPPDEGQFRLQNIDPMPETLEDDHQASLQLWGTTAQRIYFPQADDGLTVSLGSLLLQVKGCPAPRTLNKGRDVLEDVECKAGLPHGTLREIGRRHQANLSEHGAGYWHPWRMAHWGVKQDVHEVDFDHGPTWATFYFYTAWGPPSGAINTLLERYQNLDFLGFFSEEGNQEFGRWDHDGICPLTYEEVRRLDGWPWPLNDEFDDEEEDAPVNTLPANPATPRMGP